MRVKKEAELEKFFERDIIEFLDKKAQEKGALDEVQELEKALQYEDYKKATKVIERAVKRFNKTEAKEIYKEIHLNKVIELVNKAKDLTINLNEENELTRVLKLLKESRQLEQETTKNIDVFEEIRRQEREKEEEEERKNVERAKQLENEMFELNKKLFISIRKKDIKNAILQYRELKSKFQMYPSIFKDEKTEIYNDLIAFYMRIKKLKTELEQKQENTSGTGFEINRNDDLEEKSDLPSPSFKEEETPDEVPLPSPMQEEMQEDDVPEPKKPENVVEREKHLKIEEVREIVEGIKRDIEQEKFKEGKAKIINFKHKISLIPKDHEKTKSGLEKMANSLAQKLEFAKKVSNEIN